MSIDQSIVYRKFHGSIGERYQDLPSTDIPRDWDAVIPSCVNGILAHRDQDPPCNHSLLLVKNGTQDLLLRSVAAQSSISVSRTYYQQKYLLKVTPRLLLDRFEDLLQIEFFSEKAFNLAAVSPYDRPQGYTWFGDGPELDIPSNTLKAVLFGMFFRWYRKRAPVVVAVPENVDYEAYTYAAVKAIYSRLPAGLRCLMGFMTYADPAAISNHIALVFVPAQYHYANAILLDGTTTNIATLLNNVLPQDAKDMLSELSVMPKEQLKQTLEDMTAFVETDNDGNFVDLSTLYVTNYTDFWSMQGKKCENLEDPEDFALLRAFAADPRLQTGRLAEEYRRLILEEVRPEHLDMHFLDRAKTRQDPQAFYREIRSWLPLCVLGRSGSVNLEAYVWDVFWNFCAELAVKQKSRNQLEELDQAVRDAIATKITDDGNDPSANEIRLDERYIQAASERLAQLRSESLASGRDMYLRNIERFKLTLGTSPEPQYLDYRNTFLTELPEGLSRDSQEVRDVLAKGDSLYAGLLDQYTKMLEDWFTEGLSKVSDDITQQEYNDLTQRITELSSHDYVVSAPEVSQRHLLKLMEQRKTELGDTLSKSRSYRQEVTDQLLNANHSSYFQSLEELLDKRSQQNLTKSQAEYIYESIHENSCPNCLDMYLKAYQEYFQEPFYVTSLAAQPIAPYIISDLKKLSNSNVLRNLDISSLADLNAIRDRVLEHRLISEYLYGRPQMIEMWYSKNPVQIPADRLYNMLKGLTDPDPQSPPQDEKEFTDLLTFLKNTNYLTDSDGYRILRCLNNSEEDWARNLHQDETKKFLTFQIDGGMEQLYAGLTQCRNKMPKTGLDINAPVHLLYRNTEIRADMTIPLNQLYVTLGFYLGRIELPSRDKCLPGTVQNALIANFVSWGLMTPQQLISTVQALLKLDCTYKALNDRRNALILAARICINSFFQLSNLTPQDIVDMHFTIIRNDKDNKLQFENTFRNYSEDHEELRNFYLYFDQQIKKNRNLLKTAESQNSLDDNNIPFVEEGTSFFRRLLQKIKTYFGRAGNVGECTLEVIEAKQQEVRKTLEAAKNEEDTDPTETTVNSETADVPENVDAPETADAPEIPGKWWKRSNFRKAAASVCFSCLILGIMVCVPCLLEGRHRWPINITEPTASTIAPQESTVPSLPEESTAPSAPEESTTPSVPEESTPDEEVPEEIFRGEPSQHKTTFEQLRYIN